MKRCLLAIICLLCASCAWAFSPGFIGAVASGVEGVSFSDNFNRSDGVLGANWTTVNGYGGPLISSNSATGAAASIYAAIYTAGTFSIDQKACVTSSGIDSHGPIVRGITSLPTFYYAVNSVGTLILRRKINGSTTNFTTAAPAVAGDQVCLSVSGTAPVNLVVAVNGITVITYSDSITPLLVGKPGIFTFGNTGYVDDFIGSNL